MEPCFLNSPQDNVQWAVKLNRPKTGLNSLSHIPCRITFAIFSFLTDFVFLTKLVGSYHFLDKA